jgi:hypothetical protein
VIFGRVAHLTHPDCVFIRFHKSHYQGTLEVLHAMESAEKQTVTPTLAKKSNPFFSKGEEETFFQGPSKATSFFKGGSGLSAGAPAVQTKLTIGQPNDPYELEADKAADAFVQRKASAPAAPPDNPSSNTFHSTPFVIRRCEKCDAEKEKKIMKSAYGAPMEGSASKAPSVSMDEASGAGEAGIIRRCAACDAKRDKLDRKALTPEVQKEAAGGQASGGQAPGSQASGGQTNDGQASGGQAGTLESSLQSSKGSGVALPGRLQPGADPQQCSGGTNEPGPAGACIYLRE